MKYIRPHCDYFNRWLREADYDGEYEVKLLMIYADQFAYKTSVKNLESASDIDEEKVTENTLLGFIHVEPKDEENGD